MTATPSSTPVPAAPRPGFGGVSWDGAAPHVVPPPLDAPGLQTVFITGCGRSGTTILGTILSQHEQIHFLNDQFDLWVRPFPKTDIWGKRLDASAISGKIALSAADADSPHTIRRFREILGLARKRPVLVEKLAINNFRIGFLRAIVPEARFINIVRHGVEVAFSIQAKADANLWYGVKNRKWELLLEHAMLHGYTPLLKHVKTHYDRGLLEWRMSVEWAERELAGIDPDRLLRVRYEELIGEPNAVCERMESFLGLPHSPTMKTFALDGIKRQNPSADERPAPPSTEAIAGETLRRLGYWK